MVDSTSIRRCARCGHVGPMRGVLMFFSFNLLHKDGVDLRRLPLSERKRDRQRLCRKGRVSYTRMVETFPDGDGLLKHCETLGLEGVVSKRIDARYHSGPSRLWVKVKCPDWKRQNTERWRAFGERETH